MSFWVLSKTMGILTESLSGTYYLKINTLQYLPISEPIWAFPSERGMVPNHSLKMSLIYMWMKYQIFIWKERHQD